MKFKTLLGIAIALFFFAACKKDNPTIEPTTIPIEKPDPFELLRDSISYTIEGRKIVITENLIKGIINAETNIKLDSVVKQTEYTSGDRDSVMFGRFFKFSDQNRNGITISFLKKYNKNAAQPASLQTSFFLPLNKFDIFSIGERKFAIDFTRINAQNGIALELNRDYYGFQSYGYSSLAYHQALKAELQSQSKFEIINLQMLKSGKYLLEAKFNASVYYGDGSNIKTIENGYLRIKLYPESIYF